MLQIPLPASMTIAVDIKDLVKAKDPVFKAYITGILQNITTRKRDHRFLFIINKGMQDLSLSAENTEQIIAGRSATSRLLHKYWLTVQLPALLKKKGATVYISMNGACILDTNLSQYMLIADIDLLKKQGGYALKFLNKADGLITFSEKLKVDIKNYYKIPADNIAVIKAAASDLFKALSFEEKLAVKEMHAGGKEYFICTAEINGENNLLNLLKAFSVFKKRQQSGIKLLLSGNMYEKDNSFVASLATYKYREDVILTGPLTQIERARLVAAAYAWIDPALQPGLGVPALEAAACDVPVIAITGQPLLEKGAYLEADTSDHVDIAAQMMLLYKDEALCKELINKAAPATKEYSFDRSAEQLWALITKTVQ